MFSTDVQLYHYIIVKDGENGNLYRYFHIAILLIIRHESLNAIRIACTQESALTPTPSPHVCSLKGRPNLLQAMLPAGPVTDGHS